MPKPTKSDKLTDAQLTEISEMISDGSDREHIAAVLKLRMQTLNAVLAASVFDIESPIGEAIFKRWLGDSILSIAYEKVAKPEETIKEKRTVIGALTGAEISHVEKTGDEAGEKIIDHLKAGGALLKVETTHTRSPVDTKLLLKMLDRFVSREAESPLKQPKLIPFAPAHPDLPEVVFVFSLSVWPVFMAFLS